MTAQADCVAAPPAVKPAARLGRLSHGILSVATAVIAAVLVAVLARGRDNSDVLDIAYSRDGGGYSIGDSGVPETVSINGTTILRASKSGGSYCCGYTFYVAMKAAEARGLLTEKEAFQLARFQREWYGATAESKERQLVLAMENLGVGGNVPPVEARAGDFIVFWRVGGTGHSVVFLDWISEQKQIIGLKYRSSQALTQGIGDTVEYFTTSGREDAWVMPDRFYVGRLN